MKTRLEKIYDEALERTTLERANEGYIVRDELTGEVFKDTGVGKFYLCGFLGIRIRANTPMNRKLLKTLRASGAEIRKAYNGGFKYTIREYYSNGGFELHQEATRAVVDHLNLQGYEVSNACSLD